jgi:hypothetical protein
MCWCAVYLFIAPLDSDELLLERSASGSKASHFLFVDLVASIELRVVSPRGGAIPFFFIAVSNITVLVLW